MTWAERFGLVTWSVRQFASFAAAFGAGLAKNNSSQQVGPREGEMRTKSIGAMTIWILSAGTAGTSLAQRAGADHAQLQVDQIQMRLQKNPDLRNNPIGVTVHNGVATLTGSVDTEAEKSDAARLALVSGIVGVDNCLDVASSGVRQDQRKAGRG